MIETHTHICTDVQLGGARGQTGHTWKLRRDQGLEANSAQPKQVAAALATSVNDRVITDGEDVPIVFLRRGRSADQKKN